MKLTALQKFGGISLIAGSALLTAYSIFFTLLLPLKEVRHDVTMLVNNPNWIWIALIAFIGVILMIFGFIAVYSRLFGGSGFIGLLGFLFIELAYILQACKITWEICLYPVISTNASSVTLLRDFIIQHNSLVIAFKTISSTTIFIGIILFCLALVRSKEFPKVAGILLFIGAFIYGLGPALSVYLVAITGIVILSIGCMMLGRTLILNRNA